MIGFALDESNDVLIKNNQIQMINGTELTKQTVQTVIGTNTGEWCLNENEGINFQNILGKHNPDDEIIKNEIEQGLSQVDSSFIITSFSTEFDSKLRKLDIVFQAENSEKVTVEIENTFE